MPTSPPLPRARRCHTSGGPGTQESLKLRLGRCGDPRARTAPSRGLPAVGSERCQGVRHYRGRAARRRARGSRGTRVLAKLERGGRVDPRPGAPQPGGRPLRGEPGRPNQVGTRGKPAPPVRTGRLAPEVGAPGHGEGTRDGWAENSPAAKSGSAEAASSRCAPARPPAGPLACPPPPPPPSPPPLPPGCPRPPRSRFRILRVRRPARLEGASRTHSPPDGSRARPSPFPAALCLSDPSPPPLAEPPPLRVPSPPSAPAKPSSGRRLRASPRAPLAHPVRPAARRLAAPRRSRGAKWLLARRLGTRHKYVGTEP